MSEPQEADGVYGVPGHNVCGGGQRDVGRCELRIGGGFIAGIDGATAVVAARIVAEAQTNSEFNGGRGRSDRG